MSQSATARGTEKEGLARSMPTEMIVPSGEHGNADQDRGHEIYWTRKACRTEADLLPIESRMAVSERKNHIEDL